MNQPLLRKRIVVTRALEQAQELISELSSLGADIVHIPTIRFVPPESWTDCDRAVRNASSYDWLIFTSTNGVAFFQKRLAELGLDLDCFSRSRFAAVGQKTAASLEERGVRVDLLPTDFCADGLVAVFSEIDLMGARILLIKPAKSSPDLPRGLARLGAIVDPVSVYRTEIAPVERSQVAALQYAGGPHVLTFTSPSTVRNLMSQLGQDVVRAWLEAGCKTAVIGEVTANALSEFDIPADLVAATSTIHNLVVQIAEFFQNGNHTQK